MRMSLIAAMICSMLPIATAQEDDQNNRPQGVFELADYQDYFYPGTYLSKTPAIEDEARIIIKENTTHACEDDPERNCITVKADIYNLTTNIVQQYEQRYAKVVFEDDKLFSGRWDPNSKQLISRFTEDGEEIAGRITIWLSDTPSFVIEPTDVRAGTADEYFTIAYNEVGLDFDPSQFDGLENYEKCRYTESTKWDVVCAEFDESDPSPMLTYYKRLEGGVS